MTAPDRAMPPLRADERATLEGWLDCYRATPALTCEGLTEDQLPRRLRRRRPRGLGRGGVPRIDGATGV